ncbi:MAG: phosphate-starvation-inducible PsiE family protein [Deinococcota bacterium]
MSADSQQPAEAPKPDVTEVLLKVNSIIEKVIAMVVVALLASSAAILLWRNWMDLLHTFGGGEFNLARTLSEVLLALMVAEIIATISSFLRRGIFDPIPFLVVGIIASIRRLLVISAEGAELLVSNSQIPIALLIELAILTVTIGVCSWSIGYLKPRLDATPKAG